MRLRCYGLVAALVSVGCGSPAQPDVDLATPDLAGADVADLAVPDLPSFDLATADLMTADLLAAPDLLVDTTPPTFAGATGVTVISDTRLTVTWNAATDNVTPSADVVYLVCWSISTSCTTSFTAMATTPAGASSYAAGGIGILVPDTTYTFVVRARDAAGNVDSNVVTASGKTAQDTVAPTWGTGPSVTDVLADTVASSGQLSASWTAATDDAYPSSQLSYVLCWSTSSTACNGAGFTALQTTAAGATTATISGLTSNTSYTVWVRAVDPSLNTDAGDHSATAKTAISYANDINPKIFSASNATGGCSGVGCHSPQFSYANTVNQAPSPTCTGYTKLINPSDPATSLIYVSMTSSAPSACGGQMPTGGPFSTSLQTLMHDWIVEGAHDN